jgi:hypothetical protein
MTWMLHRHLHEVRKSAAKLSNSSFESFSNLTCRVQCDNTVVFTLVSIIENCHACSCDRCPQFELHWFSYRNRVITKSLCRFDTFLVLQHVLFWNIYSEAFGYYAKMALERGLPVTSSISQSQCSR